jgi:deazaflavin-dependent oxidoreductase (nitroreductase family)
MLGRLGGQPVLLLQTVGRRTGQTRTTPVQYLPREGAFVVVAANAGAARPPAWYLNLCAAPQASVRVGAQDVEVRAREVHDSERDALWRQLTAANRYLDGVASKAGRRLPVLVLAPTARPH